MMTIVKMMQQSKCVKPANNVFLITVNLWEVLQQKGPRLSGIAQLVILFTRHGSH
jgi:hypothetical protein